MCDKASSLHNRKEAERPPPQHPASPSGWSQHAHKMTAQHEVSNYTCMNDERLAGDQAIYEPEQSPSRYCMLDADAAGTAMATTRANFR